MLKIVLKIFSLILLLTIAFSTFSVFIYADENNISNDVTNIETKTSDSTKTDVEAKNILSYSCYYTPKSKTVNIKGAMNYDAFSLYGNSTIRIYSIPSGKTEMDVINDASSKPIAESPLSITFAFSFKITTIEERYSRYAVFIYTADNKYILTSAAQYAETEASFSLVENKDNFKGLVGNYSSHISNTNSEITIIPVYLDLVFTNDSSGYIYQEYDSLVSFNKKYIDELDSQIRSLSLFNTKVYLQFLLRQGGVIPTYMSQGSEYALPNVFDTETITAIHALSIFLTSRYSNQNHGTISGIVLGKAWDNSTKYNSFKDIDFEKYVLMCGHYAAIVSNAIRDVNPQLNVMLPFDGNGFFVEQDSNISTIEQLSAKMLLSLLMQYFDESTYSGLKCMILIETKETPLDITSNDILNGIDEKKETDKNKFFIGHQESISSFLEDLSTKYKSATKYYSILWIPNKELSSNALCAAYSYAFYNLWSDDNVISFNVEFSQKAENKDNLKDLIYILKNIDSDKSFEVTKKVLEYFNKKSWNELIVGLENYPTNKTNKNQYCAAEVLTKLPNKIKGKFVYFDFSEKLLADDWLNGVGCNDIKIDYLQSGKKALKSNLFVGNKDFCDLIYVYEYPENISYTPYIKFNLEISSEQIAPLYEIKFTFKGRNTTFESNAIVRGNQEEEIILNMTKAKDFELLEAVKISVRCLDESADNCTLTIKNITGYSKKYNSSTLKNLIEEERDKQKQINNSKEDINLLYRIGFVVIIILLSAVLSFSLVWILQKNNRNRK